MHQEAVWQPAIHKTVNETLYFFAIDTYSYIYVVNQLKESFQDYDCPVPGYLSYGVNDIFLPFWLNAEQFPIILKVIKSCLFDGGGGSMAWMAVEDVYYHCGCKVLPSVRMPIIADYDANELDRVQRGLSDAKKLSKFFIGTVRPPRRIAALITISQQKPDIRKRTEIISEVKTIFEADSNLSENLYGLYSGSNMCNVLLEIQVDNLDELYLITEKMHSIGLSGSKITTNILMKPITKRNNYCELISPSIEGLRGIIAQKFPKMDNLNGSEQGRILDLYEKFKPWFPIVETFFEALIEKDINKAANGIKEIATYYEVRIRQLLKEIASKRWKDNWIQRLKSMHPKSQEIRVGSYERWGLRDYVSILLSLDRARKWIAQESIPAIQDFIRVRNNVIHKGNSSVSLPDQQEVLLAFLRATDHLLQESKDH